MTLESKEREKYEKMWQIPDYRITSPGHMCSSVFFDFFGERLKNGDSITDFGCGTGLVALSFLERGLKVHLVDIARNCLQDQIEALTLLIPDQIQFTQTCLWNMPETTPATDWIYCMDVLEHLPEETVEPCLKAMAARTKKGGIFQIFLQDDLFGDVIAEKLHLTIKPQEWWINQIKCHWHIESIVPIFPDIRFCCLIGPPLVSPLTK